MQAKVDAEVDAGKTHVFKWSLYWHSEASKEQKNLQAKLSFKKPALTPKPLTETEVKLPRPATKLRKNRRPRNKRSRSNSFDVYKRKLYTREVLPNVEKLIKKIQREVQDKTVVLYSGKTPRKQAQNANLAKQWIAHQRAYDAKSGQNGATLQRGYIRIDETEVGKYLADLQQKNPRLGRDFFEPLWRKASAEVAKHATGTIVVFDEGATSDRVYLSVESKVLEARVREALNDPKHPPLPFNVILGRAPESGRGAIHRDQIDNPADLFQQFQHPAVHPDIPFADQPYDKINSPSPK
jgi:hypothetical protein